MLVDSIIVILLQHFKLLNIYTIYPPYNNNIQYNSYNLCFSSYLHADI